VQASTTVSTHVKRTSTLGINEMYVKVIRFPFNKKLTVASEVNQIIYSTVTLPQFAIFITSFES
jgi:hypothetical protein